MNEKELAAKIVGHLNEGLSTLSAPTVQKLGAARLTAMAAYRQESSRSPRNILASWAFGRSFTTRLVLPAAIVIASLTGLIYWQASNHHEGELDTTGLLAGELPIHAYTDPGFETWLKHSSYAQSQQP